MQRWSVIALTCVLTIALAGAASAQDIQIQAQVQGKVQVVQVQAAQVQIQPGAAARVAIMPGGFGINQNRMLQADAIFVGRVVAMEPMDIEATPAPNQGKVMYRVAQVQVTEIIHGVKKGTEMVRVAFVAQPNGNVAPGAIGGPAIQILPVQPQPAIQPLPGRVRPFPGNFQIQLAVGQDGLFAVSKHHKENFFLAPTSFVQRENNPNFDTEVKTAKQVAKALGNPVAALKSEDKQDRYVAAAILISKYRSNPTVAADPNKLTPPVKNEPIDANESKLILQALQGGDWAVGRFNAHVPNPFELFNQLQITQKDGYNPVNLRNQQEIATAMQKWLDENNGKYVIQKLVVDPNAKAQPVDVNPVPPNGVRPPIKLQPRPLPVQKGGVQILPVPAPAPVPVPAQPPELEVVPPQAVPAPVRRQ